MLVKDSLSRFETIEMIHEPGCEASVEKIQITFRQFAHRVIMYQSSYLDISANYTTKEASGRRLGYKFHCNRGWERHQGEMFWTTVCTGILFMMSLTVGLGTSSSHSDDCSSNNDNTQNLAQQLTLATPWLKTRWFPRDFFSAFGRYDSFWHHDWKVWLKFVDNLWTEMAGLEPTSPQLLQLLLYLWSSTKFVFNTCRCHENTKQHSCRKATRRTR